MRGRRAIDALRHEAGMYTGPLRALQGKIVPLFYGFFSGVVDGVEIGVLILEWCPRNDWVTFGRPTEGELLKRMEAVRMLHLAGVKHGQLYERRDSLRLYDGRHFLRAPDGTMRIVGFQHAKMHRCAGGLRECDSVKSPLEGRCRELCYAEVHGRRAMGLVGEAPWRPY
ncbi:hypothetical protein BD413DRAFT_465812 [Trametes elegans]|nr:hypothetical protein BD413DRAFT_465812 [Trametes elegans]